MPVYAAEHDAVADIVKLEWLQLRSSTVADGRELLQVESLTQQLRERELEVADRDRKLAVLSEVLCCLCQTTPATVSLQETYTNGVLQCTAARRESKYWRLRKIA